MRPTPLPIRPPRLLVALGAAFALLGACAVPSGTLPRTPPAPPLPGATGVVLAAGSTPTELIAHDLGSGERVALRLPAGAEEIFDGRWQDDTDSALVAARANGANALYLVTPDDPPERLSEPVQAGRFEIGDDKVLASRCRLIGPAAGPSPGRFEGSGPDRQTGRISVLDLSGGRVWAPVARGCIAALSPEADEVAYSPEGTTLRIRSLDGTADREVLDVRVLGLQAVEGKQFTIKGPMVWGEEGIAVALDADGSDTIVRLSSDAEAESVLPLEPQARDFFVGLSWSDDGSRLAIPAYTYLGYVNATGSVGLADSAEEGYRVISVHPSATSRAVWAPDGGSLLLAGDPNEPWIVTDLGGRWVQRVAGQEAIPLDWGAR